MRDLRDPEKLGQLMLKMRKLEPALPFHEIANWTERWTIPEVSKHESLGTETVKTYQAELRERTKQGDKYAISLLQGDHSEDPSGE